MPLVEVFAREEHMPKIPAAEFCHFLQEHFQVEPGVVQVMMTTVKDLAPEPVYISLRAKGTPPRREKVGEILAGIGRWLAGRGLDTGKIRIELFEPSQQAVHAWRGSKL
mmetsp:Transcript_36384/g.67745  ORF Transcript_36384/g.67745 Transcript_36384/m.67745 type:complete len:109 (-) Transcript_36384:50-376(-)